uniref:Uncharacterized protein n=1 Tax=Tanacetum cinerariifolium TaxID=118510 RepID=A0A699HVE7_TANCI|nr:hypothetical protein [Tanacetum cinerariifolium]
MSSRKTRARASTTEFEEVMKQDDEYYEQHVAGGTVAYMKRKGQLNINCQYNEWEACPEPSPFGDILSASDFSATSFVLIVHQHKLRVKLYNYVMIIGVVVK